MTSSGNFNFQQAYTSANQLSGWTYDASGNLLNDGLGNNYTYDPEGKILGVSGYTYVYDTDGNRVSKSGSSAIDHIYFGGREIAKLTGGQWTDLIYGTNGLVAEVPGTQYGAPVYRMLDQLGTQVGTLDPSGVLLSLTDYAPFGQVFTGGSNDPYKFTGKERDTESGNDYFGKRYYASSMGRWMSPDRINLTEDRMMNPSSTLNKYAYGANNPLKYVDPDGQDITIYYEAANPPFSVPGHTMLLAYNQATGDSATRSFGPDKSSASLATTLKEGVNIGVPGTDTFGYEDIKSPDDLRNKFASITIQTNPEEAQEVIDAIRAHPDGDYKTYWNNCTTTCSKLLRMIGKTSSHALTPEGFFNDLYARQINDPLAPRFQFRNGYDYGRPRSGYDAFQMFFWLMGSNDRSSVTTTSTNCVTDSNGQRHCDTQ